MWKVMLEHTLLTSHAVWPCRGFIIYELLPWGIGIKWTKKHMDRNTEKLNWCLNVKTHKHVLVWDFLGWDIYGLWLLLLLSYYACVKYPLLKLFELLIRIILIVEETIPVFLSSFNTQHRFLKMHGMLTCLWSSLPFSSLRRGLWLFLTTWCLVLGLLVKISHMTSWWSVCSHLLVVLEVSKTNPILAPGGWTCASGNNRPSGRILEWL